MPFMQSTNIYWMPIMYESLLSEIERQQGEKQTDRQTKKKKNNNQGLAFLMFIFWKKDKHD